jgi:hypothetical protein
MLQRESIPVKGRTSAKVKGAAKPATMGAKERTPAKAREAAQRIRAPDTAFIQLSQLGRRAVTINRGRDGFQKSEVRMKNAEVTKQNE